MNFLIEKSLYIREKFLIKNLFDIKELINYFESFSG